MMIKPCPFCGKEAYLEKKPLWRECSGSTRGYFGSYEFVIECPDPECGCRVHLGANDTIYRSEEEAKKNAIEAWNRRAKGEET